MSCEFCDFKPAPCDLMRGRSARGKNMANKKGISAHIWDNGLLVIETCVDDVWVNIQLRFCPKCGRKLERLGMQLNPEFEKAIQDMKAKIGIAKKDTVTLERGDSP